MILNQLSSAIAAPVCAVFIWVVLGGFIGSICMTLRAGWSHVQRLHTIPCNRCAYFTGDYRLKCTVHPCKALSEEAIDCLDFEPAKLRAKETRAKETCTKETCAKRCKQSKSLIST